VERLRDRARGARTRAEIRAWNYRQRHLAAGVWFRVRRALARARAAYAITDEDARQLIAEGFEREASGQELAPVKTLLFVDDARLAQVAGRRAIPVGLGPEFFAASSIALVSFGPEVIPPPRPPEDL
jgi:hypothetical protein